jgi:hypothetical protein
MSPCRQCGGSLLFGKQWCIEWEKDFHARRFNHGAYSCQVTGCDRTFITSQERNAHEWTPHISGHGRVLTSTPNDCVECDETLRSKANLLRHAKETQHQPYGCECGLSSRESMSSIAILSHSAPRIPNILASTAKITAALMDSDD